MKKKESEKCIVTPGQIIPMAPQKWGRRNHSHHPPSLCWLLTPWETPLSRLKPNSAGVAGNLKVKDKYSIMLLMVRNFKKSNSQKQEIGVYRGGEVRKWRHIGQRAHLPGRR